MKSLSTSSLLRLSTFFALVTGCIGVVSVQGCKAGQNSLTGTNEVASLGTPPKNGGFRILPQLAARDEQRFKVIYRCNDVQCGEAFQPSNEERDIFIPCGLESKLYPDGRYPAFVRVLGSAGQQKLIVRPEHQQACQKAQAFEKVVAETEVKENKNTAGAGTTCRSYRGNQEGCLANAEQGCRWVTHPSGRASVSGQGDCVGLYRSATQPSGVENVQSLSPVSQPAGWAPVESYRSAGAGLRTETK